MSTNSKKLTGEERELLKRAEAILRGCAEKEVHFVEGPMDKEQERLKSLLRHIESDYDLGS